MNHQGAMHQQHLPVWVQQRANGSGLGNVQSIYKRGYGAYRDGQRATGLGLFVMCGFLLVLALVNGGTSSFLHLGLIGDLLVLGALLGALLIYSASKPVPISVLICDGGLLLSPNGKPEIVRWDQIESYTKKASSGMYSGADEELVTEAYTVTRKDGKTFLFNVGLVHEISLFGADLEEHLKAALLPQMLAASRAGQELSFGEIVVRPQGLAVSRTGAFLPWNALDDLQIVDDRVGSAKELVLFVYQAGGQIWYQEAVAKIPNIALLQGAIDEACGLHSALASYAAGTSVSFGRLSISEKGMTQDNGLMLAWSPMVGIVVQNNRLQIGTFDLQSWQFQRHQSKVEAIEQIRQSPGIRGRIATARELIGKVGNPFIQEWYAQACHEIPRFYVLKALLRQVSVKEGVKLLLR